MQNESDKKEEIVQNMNVEATIVDDSFASPSKDMFAGYAPVTAEQALESAHALIHHYFHTDGRDGNRTVRVGIPARPDYDDDLILTRYLRQQLRRDGDAKPSSTKTGDEVQRLNPTSSPPILQGEGNNAD